VHPIVPVATDISVPSPHTVGTHSTQQWRVRSTSTISARQARNTRVYLEYRLPSDREPCFLFCSNVFCPFFSRGTTSRPVVDTIKGDLKRRNSSAPTRSQQSLPLCLSFPMRRSHKKSTLAPAGSGSGRVTINIAYTIAPKIDVGNCAKRTCIKDN
jgi:hypothetical protein